MGKALKRLIAKHNLPVELVSHQWFEYEDINGYGCCQIDHMLICPGFIILLECKLTYNPGAEGQMYNLYVPVLAEVYGCPVVCVQAFKNVSRQIANRIDNLKALVMQPRNNVVWNWHYLA